MEDEIERSRRNYNHFIKECIQDLKNNKLCYVYKQEQIQEIRQKFKEELIVEKNECGYTIKVKRGKKNDL